MLMVSPSTIPLSYTSILILPGSLSILVTSGFARAVITAGAAGKGLGVCLITGALRAGVSIGALVIVLLWGCLNTGSGTSFFGTALATTGGFFTGTAGGVS